MSQKKRNINRKKGSHVFFPRPLIFKFQQDVLKINDICVSWSLPRTDREMNFLNLEIEALRKSVFLNRNYLSKYLTLSLLINLFIYYTDFRNIQLNEHVEIYDGNYLSKYLTFLHLLTYLFFNWLYKHPLKEDRCKFKIDKLTYSKS